VKRRGLVIAIDGTVGTGKTTTAQRVAERLGYRHLDTGAMYRAVTLAATCRGVEPEDEDALEALLATSTIDLDSGGGRVLLDGQDISEAIRRPDITRRAGAYANVPLVRHFLVAQQQRLGQWGGVVAEGRDIAAVVFPDAELKIALVADLDERAQRRHRELTAKGVCITLEQVRSDIQTRDREDAVRDYGGTSTANEIVEIDTTDMTLEDQVDCVVALARQRGA
jgi:cytidylate kinase